MLSKINEKEKKRIELECDIMILFCSLVIIQISVTVVHMTFVQRARARL